MLIRIMAANLTSGNYQSYDGDSNGPAGIRIMQALKPDIILIQEFNYKNDTAADFRSLVDQVCGTECVYYREGGGQNIPNGVISRWPFISSGEWDDVSVPDRDFAYARIDIPGSKDLFVVSIHLPTDATKRRTSVDMYLNPKMQGDPVATFAYRVIGGDFNTDSVSEYAITALPNFMEKTVMPVDQNGNHNTNEPRGKPYDRVLPDLDLDTHRVPVVVGSHSYPTGLVFDSRVFTPLSEVPPVLYGDCNQFQMQHMAVVKDFLIPIN